MENITSKVKELADLCSSIKKDILKKARLEAEKIVNEVKLEKGSLEKQVVRLRNEKKKLENRAGKIIDEARLKKENLKEQIQKLETEKKELCKKKEILERKINAHVKGRVIKLNVGGRIFTTTTTTLWNNVICFSIWKV